MVEGILMQQFQGVDSRLRLDVSRNFTKLNPCLHGRSAPHFQGLNAGWRHPEFANPVSFDHLPSLVFLGLAE
jgi:hypothetical protein